MASGSWLRQTSTASSPFSASEIWKSSPSRIRRATFRITLESSTIKQVFMILLLHASRAAPPCCSLPSSRSRCRRRGTQVQHAVDVEHDQELTIEPEDAGRYDGELAVEI